MRALDDTICSKKESCKEYRGVMISERLRKMLTYSRIYLSNPEVFNDPFDGYFSIQFESEQDKDDAKKIIERKAEQFVKEGTNELENNEALDRNRYFWLIIKLYERETIKNFWISAVTEDGILLFVKIKARLTCLENMSQIVLLQQTTYSKSQDELCALYR